MLENALHNEDRIVNEYLCIKPHGSNIHKAEITEDVRRNRNTLVIGNFSVLLIHVRINVK